MLSEPVAVAIVAIVGVLLVLVVLAIFIVTCFRYKKEQGEEGTREQVRPQTQRRYVNRCGRVVLTNQQEDIFNISSRVQGQGQWPTHDAHVSLDHFTLTNEINKYNDAPPSYEEAMNIAAANNNNSVVPAVAPKVTTLPPPSSAVTTSTSTSTTSAN